MKKFLVQKSVFCLMLVAAAGGVWAQADSGDIPPLRGTPNRLPLAMQELQIIPPANVNNITNVTQVVQPNVTTAAGSASGFRFATAWANCGGATLLGGGGSCRADNGYAAMPTSQPNGNNWQVTCDAFQGGNVVASAWATCSN